MSECVISWKKTSANSISETITYCCEKLKEAVEKGYHAHITKGKIGHIPHYQIGYIYEGTAFSHCPFCGSPIRAEEVKRR